MKKTILLLAAALLALPAMAETEEFQSEEKLEAGFLTGMLNQAIEKGMASADAKAQAADSAAAVAAFEADAKAAQEAAAALPAKEKMKYGRTVTDYVSAPKFGGYVIGTYKYNSADETNTFDARLCRAYVDGTILKDFKYRLQVQFTGTVHIKDFFIDWQHWKEFGIKVGQYKRCFTFENPYNPWDVGVGDYSQLVKQFAGMGDQMVGEANMGGRDMGIQVHGDLFPIMEDKHRLMHYEIGVYNGQGINAKDKDKKKDVIATLQFQPLKNWYIGGFYWYGDYVNADGTALQRNRFAVGSKYETSQWSARAEYARECGDNYHGADAFYATLGIPCTKWLKIYAKYDGYNQTGNWADGNHIFSIAPDFQIHKNLMLQLQYNCVYNRTKETAVGHQFWVETYVRF